eukprot:1544963-Alexandrium_andersonii.AAC.1
MCIRDRMKQAWPRFTRGFSHVVGTGNKATLSSPLAFAGRGHTEGAASASVLLEEGRCSHVARGGS